MQPKQQQQQKFNKAVPKEETKKKWKLRTQNKRKKNQKLVQRFFAFPYTRHLRWLENQKQKMKNV